MPARVLRSSPASRTCHHSTLCRATLPVVEFVRALAPHSTLTRLDLVGAAIAEAELGACALGLKRLLALCAGCESAARRGGAS